MKEKSKYKNVISSFLSVMNELERNLFIFNASFTLKPDFFSASFCRRHNIIINCRLFYGNFIFALFYGILSFINLSSFVYVWIS